MAAGSLFCHSARSSIDEIQFADRSVKGIGSFSRILCGGCRAQEQQSATANRISDGSHCCLLDIWRLAVRKNKFLRSGFDPESNSHTLSGGSPLDLGPMSLPAWHSGLYFGKCRCTGIEVTCAIRWNCALRRCSRISSRSLRNGTRGSCLLETTSKNTCN